MSEFCCNGCGTSYPSRNALFRHLSADASSCYVAADYQKANLRTEKTALLVGYYYCFNNNDSTPPITSGTDDEATDAEPSLAPGQQASEILYRAICQLEHQDPPQQPAPVVFNRSYGNSCRGSVLNVAGQDARTAAVTELLTLRLTVTDHVDEWIVSVNQQLLINSNDETMCVRVLGRTPMPAGKFDAEMDCTHRKIAYLLPADFLSSPESNTSESGSKEFFASLPSFEEGAFGKTACEANPVHPCEATRLYLHALKKKMQLLTTKVNVTKSSARTTALHRRDESSHQENDTTPANNNSKRVKPASTRKRHSRGNRGKQKQKDRLMKLVKRRRYHNFSPVAMAHEVIAYRSMDGFCHRATLRFCEGKRCDPGTHDTLRPFVLLSLTGDVFLRGQACRIIGVFIALARGLIDEDIVDCLFDEHYGHLIPTPPAPSIGMYASEAAYHSWEGKLKAVLNPRVCEYFSDGFCDVATLRRVEDWRNTVQGKMARDWLVEGVDEGTGRLTAERIWTEQVLLPWVVQARQELVQYRQWKNTKNQGVMDDVMPLTLAEVNEEGEKNDDVPHPFAKVLECLRTADTSGQWPSTTHKRQLVMISELHQEASGADRANKATSLSQAHAKGKTLGATPRLSPYAFKEGNGGASGSFSVGFMPGDCCTQPKGNVLFPELTKAAFELERALCPDRPPSSTIAINRNAQFRPHTDSGAGAGQSTSLIVALGNFTGGELVVEGSRRDIRYKATEFDGWKERHWTMPFQGERFSLVWFTPKGCEGMRGLDLFNESDRCVREDFGLLSDH